MSSPPEFTLNQPLLSITVGDTNMTAQTDLLPEYHYDMSFVGVGNFFSGTYKQLSDSPDDIESNVILTDVNNKGLDHCAFFNLTTSSTDGTMDDDQVAPISVSEATLSNYGKEILPGNFSSTHSVGVTQMKIPNPLSTPENDLDEVIDISTLDGNIHTKFKHIPMSSKQTDVIIVDGSVDPLNPINILEVNKCEVYSGLYEAISLALFKKTGKTAGLLNEGNGDLFETDAAGDPTTTPGSGILYQIRKQFGDAWHGVQETTDGSGNPVYTPKATDSGFTSTHGVVENAATKLSSRFFQRYVDSGRYAHDAGNGPLDINQEFNYNFDGMKINMIVELSGTVNDIAGGADGETLTAMTDIQIDSVFGANVGEAAGDDTLFGSADGANRTTGLKHLVARGGATYKVRCLVQLIQNDSL